MSTSGRRSWDSDDEARLREDLARLPLTQSVELYHLVRRAIAAQWNADMRDKVKRSPEGHQSMLAYAVVDAITLRDESTEVSLSDSRDREPGFFRGGNPRTPRPVPPLSPRSSDCHGS
jgi:hypothetical protein